MGGFGSTNNAFAAVSRDLAADLRGRYRNCRTVPTGLAVNIWNVQVSTRIVSNQEAAGMVQGVSNLRSGSMKLGDLEHPLLHTQEYSPMIKQIRKRL